jgi:hypothetical protein
MASAPKDDPKTALMSTQFGMGQLADGSFDTFPLSELAARVAARDADEAALQREIDMAAQGEADLEDVSDLDGLADIE